MGPVALGKIFVYFAKKNCQRVLQTSATGVSFALTKFCPTLPRAPWALRFFVRRFYRTFLFVQCHKIHQHLPTRVQVWYHVNSKARQTEKNFNATSMDRENFARFPYQNFDFQRFQGAAGIGPYMSLLTDEQEQRGSSFNYYGSQIFSSQIINEEQSSKSIPPNLLLLLQLLHRIRNSMKH